jgi:[acyl-carrier-protein] S-malonyltransferase
MLIPWLANPAAARRIDEWSEAANLDLAAHGTTSDAATIRSTAIAQPLIVAASLLAFEAVSDAVPALREPPTVVVGHSVGEFAAAAIAGALTPAQAVAAVAERGRAMAECAAKTPTGMSAVIGGEPRSAIAAIEAAGLEAANINGPGQVVAAGTLDALAALEAAPPKGARVRRLDVAGAFHTAYMAGATTRLGRVLDDFGPAPHAPKEPATPTPAPAVQPSGVRALRLAVISNLDGQAVVDGATLLHRLVSQVTLPVRWDLVLDRMADIGVTATLELAPAGVLTGLTKRALPKIARTRINRPQDAGALLETLRATGATA